MQNPNPILKSFSYPKIFLKLLKIFARIEIFFIFASELEANHNKDYSVVKTCKAAQVAFFRIK